MLHLQQARDLDLAALEALGVRAVARLKDGATQLLLGPAAIPVHAAVRAAIEG